MAYSFVPALDLSSLSERTQQRPATHPVTTTPAPLLNGTISPSNQLSLDIFPQIPFSKPQAHPPTACSYLAQAPPR
jgi:hypothetical protein